MTKQNYNPYEELANAIITFAAADYRKALRELKRNPHSHTARGMRTSVLRFFRSDWFKCLTDLDGEYLIEKLNKEVC